MTWTSAAIDELEQRLRRAHIVPVIRVGDPANVHVVLPAFNHSECRKLLGVHILYVLRQLLLRDRNSVIFWGLLEDGRACSALPRGILCEHCRAGHLDKCYAQGGKCYVTKDCIPHGVSLSINCGSADNSRLDFDELLQASAGTAGFATGRQTAIDVAQVVGSEAFGARAIDEIEERTVLRTADANPGLPAWIPYRASAAFRRSSASWRR